MKRCPRCGKAEPEATFGKNSARSDGKTTYCKNCKSAMNRDYRRRKKEQRLRLSPTIKIGNGCIITAADRGRCKEWLDCQNQTCLEAAARRNWSGWRKVEP